MTIPDHTSRAGAPLTAVDLLVELDRSSREPLRRQLEAELRRAIADGRLPDGARLPSSRSLAEQLGVSRGVVVDAYDQLVAQGLLTARPRHVPVVRAVEVPKPAPARRPRRHRFIANANSPDLSLFPRRAWAKATAEVMRGLPDDDLDYPADDRGAIPLRGALVNYLSRVRRVAVDLDGVILTQGFLHGLDLICRVLARRGITRIAVENPSIPEQVAIAERHGIAVQPITVDDGGVVVDELRAGDAGAIIVTPAHQFPLGVVLAPDRRQALAAWARERDGLIIENDYGAEFRYDGPPIAAVQSLAPEHTLYLGTTSKSLAPAVRIGWIVAPQGIASELTGAYPGGGLNAFVVARLFESGEYERHVQRCRRDYRRRRNTLVASLSEQLPELRILGAAGGLHVTVRLPAGHDAAAVADAAASEGVDIRPLSYYAHGSHEPGLVLGYGRLPLASVPGAVSALARAMIAASSRTAPSAASACSRP